MLFNANLINNSNGILNTSNKHKKIYKIIKNLIGHHNKALKFFDENYESVNVDGLFGVRISQVNIKIFI